MSIELQKGFYSMVTGASPQTSAAGRVYPMLPQGVTLPAILYQQVTASRQHALDSTVGVTSVTLQVDCLADSDVDAWTLADEVRTILHGYRGAWGTLTARHVSLQSENKEYDQDGDRVTHWVTQRYMIYTDMD